MSRTNQLVEEALGKLEAPYGEDVVDEVLGIIESGSGMLAEYWSIIEDGKKEGKFLQEEGDINPLVSQCVKRMTGGRVMSKGNPCKMNALAKTYTKLADMTAI